MRASELTTAYIKEYLRVPATLTDDDAFIADCKAAAISFVVLRTGLTAAEVDTFPDLTVVVLELIQDFYDNRAIQIDYNKVSETADAILRGRKVVGLI